MKIKNTFHLIFIYSLFLVGCSTDDGGGEMDNTNTTPEPTPKETFGNWSPDFTNQTSDFTQTRTGSQGTQQTRTINVTSSSVTTSSTEESINQDLNDDGDLFEEIEEVITTYTGSENLGNHQTKTYNIIEDNDMGFTVGNNFYSLNNGWVSEEYDFRKELTDCSGQVFERDIYFYSEGIYFDGESLEGSGSFVNFDIFSSSSDFSIGVYTDFLNIHEDRYNQSFDYLDQFEDWYETNYGETPSIEYLPCDSLPQKSVHHGYSGYVDTNKGGYIEGGDFEFNFNEGELTIEVDSENVYTIKLTNGVDENQIPFKLFYKGYLRID